jgi:hypothetical protein
MQLEINLQTVATGKQRVFFINKIKFSAFGLAKCLRKMLKLRIAPKLLYKLVNDNALK